MKLNIWNAESRYACSWGSGHALSTYPKLVIDQVTEWYLAGTTLYYRIGNEVMQYMQPVYEASTKGKVALETETGVELTCEGFSWGGVRGGAKGCPKVKSVETYPEVLPVWDDYYTQDEGMYCCVLADTCGDYVDHILDNCMLFYEATSMADAIAKAQQFDWPDRRIDYVENFQVYKVTVGYITDIYDVHEKRQSNYGAAYAFPGWGVIDIVIEGEEDNDE